MYNVYSLPLIILIDKKGKIVFKGHPQIGLDSEDIIEKLRNGIEL